ncbi:uncharacterized protein LOC132696694 [Cylas formicarius]|uniref:uncharacterized protein LOC132696694 n=1 Tax=Cylas formicarius TaxID=197179 RepID=UPI0029587ABE|nr:uncharacterized protein LOC132696694 [Cylas formicarius]XP_060517659.1 uncharacterized protein LOC132696694 [Cylas formicarius]
METANSKTLDFNFKGTEDSKKDTHIMTSSTISTASSLISPGDSGVQLFDSESELTSTMSGWENDITRPDACSEIICNDAHKNNDGDHEVKLKNPVEKIKANEKPDHKQSQKLETPKSDIANQNVCSTLLSCSVPNYFDKFFNDDINSLQCTGMEASLKSPSDDVFEMEHPIKLNTDVDLMNISLNSYELLDYTLQNTILKPDTENIDMHVSISEEVNENLKTVNTENENVPAPVKEEFPVEAVKPTEEQIVFRRQRRKKSKSDTPKKRVSFHEDILNSTKVDDIHINLGFITHEPDVSYTFFQKGFTRKPDVVKGRYSWAAEGDAPYYEKSATNREVKSDIYVHNPRYSSTSSSSTGSVSSSIDEEDTTSDENLPKREPSVKMPKSSCLKKSKRNKKYIDTKIVQEETDLRKRKSETNMLESNIFGSLKNILNFSTSVPLAERGVPEGQEDVCIYSSSHDVFSSTKPLTSFSFKGNQTKDVKEVVEDTEIKIPPTSQVSLAKTNLKLTQSEGFYPNYPNQDLPANIILCDSNVYEHKGISYSYEYDNFQKTFEQQNKPKSSLVYQMILKEFNFFRRKAKEEPEKEAEDFEVINHASTPKGCDTMVEEVIEQAEEKIPNTPKNPMGKYTSSAKLDWSDTETISDLSEVRSNSRHLESPKRRINKHNHYAVASSSKNSFLYEQKSDAESSKSLPTMRTCTSKSSLINRFLRNVTQKKLLDIKAMRNQRRSRSYISLYVSGCKVDKKCNEEIDKEIEKEITRGKEKQLHSDISNRKMMMELRKQVFRKKTENLVKIFPVRSAYTTNGESKPLLVILTDITIYICSAKQNNFSNHFVLPYAELNIILIGPNNQTIHFSNYDTDMQCLISTGCSSITNDIVSLLEITMRKDTGKPRLPAVKQLTMRDMACLRNIICKQTSVEKDEEYYYYSIVNIQDFSLEDMISTPLGPAKEGPLMFKTTDSNRWETAYFILKAGVLYMFSSASQRVPMRVFPLINGSCQGAHRIFNAHRPHTFQLIVEGKSLLLAAPDEYVASEWLQELIHAASGIYHKDKSLTLSCSLMMTSEHILTVREAFPHTITTGLSKKFHEPLKGPQALSCAAIVDLISFRLPSAEQSWCILEFSCREVHEYSGDWILYFSSNAELESFISTLEMLWQYNNENDESFPLSTIPETDPLSKRCVDTYTTLIERWPTNTVHLQFL